MFFKQIRGFFTDIYSTTFITELVQHLYELHLGAWKKSEQQKFEVLLSLLLTLKKPKPKPLPIKIHLKYIGGGRVGGGSGGVEIFSFIPILLAG